MTDRSIYPYAIAGCFATVSALYYIFSPLSLRKSHYTVSPVTIRTSASAQEIYLFLRDPTNYLDLTPESQYTVITSEQTHTGIDYTLHHQITSNRVAVTKCRRDWDDAKRQFWDSFPLLGAPFRVGMNVVEDDKGKVTVGAEMEIEATAGLRAFFGIVSPRQVRTRLQRLKQKFESEGK
jgi:hypothetical protein